MLTDSPTCLYCERTSDQIPLILMNYQGRQVYICPQHLPILIHKPAQLADKLPGAERFGPPEGHDH
jgi:hypothetical protein